MNGWHLVSGGKCNNRTAMHAHEAVGHDHETAARFAAKRANGGFNFGVVAHGELIARTPSVRAAASKDGRR